VALSEKHRSRFYDHFVEHVGEEAAEAMLAQFPSRDLDEPATKDFVRAEIAGVRAEIAKVRADMAEMEMRLNAQFAVQTDRLMTRIQWAVGMGFGFLAVLTTVLTLASN
jgi:hypothetical protein